MTHTYGIPNERVLIAIREELEMMGIGDEAIRKLTIQHEPKKLIDCINQVLVMDIEAPVEALMALLNPGLPKGKSLGKSALEAIKKRLPKV